MQAESSHQILSLYIRPEKRGPVQEVDRARLEPGKGLDGDHDTKEIRQVTILDKASWTAACEVVGKEIDPIVRRANVYVEGPSLSPTIGKRIRLGPVLIEVLGETTPCQLMEDTVPGLLEALEPEGRGGVYGRVLEGGEIGRGDRLEVLES